jgi:hypothetical protein
LQRSRILKLFHQWHRDVGLRPETRFVCGFYVQSKRANSNHDTASMRQLHAEEFKMRTVTRPLLCGCILCVQRALIQPISI